MKRFQVFHYFVKYSTLLDTGKVSMWSPIHYEFDTKMEVFRVLVSQRLALGADRVRDFAELPFTPLNNGLFHFDIFVLEVTSNYSWDVWFIRDTENS